MATNRLYPMGELNLPKAIAVAADARTSNFALSNDPVLIGKIPGVALEDADSVGSVVVQSDGIFSLLVAGIDDSGSSGADANVTVKSGDEIFFDKTKAPPLSKRSSAHGGTHFGYAFGDAGVTLVASGNTTTKIAVKVG